MNKDNLFMDFNENKILVQKSDPVIDVDGNSYSTIKMGYGSIWMAENLKVIKYRNKIEIPYVNNDLDWQSGNTGKCCDYFNDFNNSTIYGRLYNWFAIDNMNKIAPDGWHIPSLDEWIQLISYVGSIGGKLKEAGTSHWNAPNEGATNESLFTALPGGCRDGFGKFEKLRTTGVWWSATIATTQTARYFVLRNGHVCAGIFNGGMSYGMSVRCVKDY